MTEYQEHLNRVTSKAYPAAKYYPPTRPQWPTFGFDGPRWIDSKSEGGGGCHLYLDRPYTLVIWGEESDGRGQVRCSYELSSAEGMIAQKTVACFDGILEQARRLLDESPEGDQEFRAHVKKVKEKTYTTHKYALPKESIPEPWEVVPSKNEYVKICTYKPYVIAVWERDSKYAGTSYSYELSTSEKIISQGSFDRHYGRCSEPFLTCFENAWSIIGRLLRPSITDLNPLRRHLLEQGIIDDCPDNQFNTCTDWSGMKMIYRKGEYQIGIELVNGYLHVPPYKILIAKDDIYRIFRGYHLEKEDFGGLVGQIEKSLAAFKLEQETAIEGGLSPIELEPEPPAPEQKGRFICTVERGPMPYWLVNASNEVQARERQRWGYFDGHHPLVSGTA